MIIHLVKHLFYREVLSTVKLHTKVYNSTALNTPQLFNKIDYRSIFDFIEVH